MRFTKLVNIDIENIYGEFEKSFTQSIEYAEQSCYDFENNVFKTDDCKKYVIENKIIDKIFIDDIDIILKHIIEQFKTYTPIQLVSYIKKQSFNYNNYLPEKRKIYIYKNYLVYNIASGDERILIEGYRQTEKEKQYIRYIFERYQYYYRKLYDSANEIFNDYKALNIFIANSQNKNIKTSYLWKAGSDKELPDLYRLMIDKYKLIASESTYEQFKTVFTSKPIDGSFEPIRWHQENASELLYFIVRLEQSDSIEHNPKRADYQKIKACFVKPDGKPFDVVWKSLKTNVDINLSPDKQKAIDELVNYFL